MKRRLFAAASMMLATTLAACADERIIVDDWGPPVGYARLNGTVQQADGAPAANVGVTFTRCGPPIGGFLTAATTTAAGTFEATAHLPPIVAVSRFVVDTLQLRCAVLLDRASIARDSVTVRFGAAAATAPTTRVTLRLP